ncbi:hypothetical protein Pfo_025846 [Paulownia fortunei]|nr:hypothetical protein Pfo_025846 [Paulownia fortunei]
MDKYSIASSLLEISPLFLEEDFSRPSQRKSLILGKKSSALGFLFHLPLTAVRLLVLLSSPCPPAVRPAD